MLIWSEGTHLHPLPLPPSPPPPPSFRNSASSQESAMLVSDDRFDDSCWVACDRGFRWSFEWMSILSSPPPLVRSLTSILYIQQICRMPFQALQFTDCIFCVLSLSFFFFFFSLSLICVLFLVLFSQSFSLLSKNKSRSA